MKSYKVEEIKLGSVVATHVVDAATPFEAAAVVTCRTVTLRRGEDDWIKVSETMPRPGRNKRRPVEYEYHAIGRRSKA
jgi:hypothetical protein